jgi:protein-disulfide isomerase/uncharacterized membrane protein
MRRAFPLAALRALLLLALSASAALLYDYTRPVPAFCEAGAGCDAVRSSSFAYVLGVPQPALGLFAYAFVFTVSLLPRPRRSRLLLPLASLGALLGVAFLAIQAFVIQRFCSLCVVVDVSSILIAGLAWVDRRAESHDGAVPRAGWSLVAAMAVVVPLLLGAAWPEPSLPPAVARLWVPGKLTIVELSDFECPFCRILHPALKEATEPYGDKVHFVRLSVPLRSHPNARVAAIAYACAKKLGQGEAMAHTLFGAKDLSEQGCRDAAATVGLDPAAFDACFSGPEGEAAMLRDAETAREIQFKGLPTTFIGTRSVIGALNVDELREAIDAELQGKTPARHSVPQGWMWVMLSFAFVATALWSVLRVRADA